MSRLDFLAQTPSRSVDASASRRAVSAADGEASNGGEKSGFESLLEGLTNGKDKDVAAASRDESYSWETGKGGASLKVPIDALASQERMTTASPDAAVQNASGDQPGNAPFSLLESLLPQVLAQTADAFRQQARQNGQSMSPFSMASQQAISVQDLMMPGSGPKLSISVQGQETHFRPIIETFGAALAETAMDSTAEPLKSASGENLLAKHAADGVKIAQPGEPVASDEAPVTSIADNLGQEKIDEQRSVSKGSLERLAERVNLEKQNSAPVGKSDGASLPFATLQQITRAIVEDAKAANGSRRGAHQGNGEVPSTIVRSSAGALRILNLQLNPVELGPMTIRMRLSGDSLEMELQVESERTAELLRSDTEKLSGLLKGAGYHPDVLNIQSTESTAHDRAQLQRSQHSQQTQGQTFQQGAASDGGRPFHQRNDHQEQSQSERSRDSRESRSSENPGRSGVYL